MRTFLKNLQQGHDMKMECPEVELGPLDCNSSITPPLQ